MEIVLLQMLQWILRIILFLLLLVVVLIVIVLIVPIRYQAEGELLEKKPGGQGKITWFFYLIYMRFYYKDKFHIVVRVFGIKVYDSEEKRNIFKKKQNSEKSINSEEIDRKITENEIDTVEEVSSKKEVEIQNSERTDVNIDDEVKQKIDYDLKDLEREMKAEDAKESKIADEMKQKYSANFMNAQPNDKRKEKKSFFSKLADLKQKVRTLIQKIKEIINKIQEGKLKVEHYVELWNRKEVQVTFSRAKSKLKKIIKAFLPKKWAVTGEIGFEDISLTGRIMGVLGAMYPITGKHVQIVPDFEKEVMFLKGNVKGYIRLGNLLYQVLTLILNVHCFKFIKLVLDELNGSNKSQKQSNLKKKKET